MWPRTEERPRVGAYLPLALVLAIGSGFWLQRLGVNDLDDAASNEVIFARQPLATLLFDARWPDQSPLYFVVLHFWRAFGESPRAMALLQLALLSVGVVLVHRVARRLCRPRAVADGATLLAALSPASLWLVRNGRMYTLQLVLFLAALSCLMRFQDERRPRDLLGFALASVLGIYNHFFGLLITAALILWLCGELALEAYARRAAGDEPAGARPFPRRVLPYALAWGLVIAMAAAPQAARMLAFAHEGGRILNSRSLPGLSLLFLREVSAFWFVNTQPGVPSPPLLVTAVYFAVIYGSVAFGTASGSRRFRLLVLVALILPLLTLGLAAFRLDLRPRYFIYMLPLIWMAVANAALGAEHSTARLPSAARVGRTLLFVAVASCSTWLVTRKLPERYPQWTKLMKGLQKLDWPGMAVYMPPGPEMGSPMIVAEHLDLGPHLCRIRRGRGSYFSSNGTVGTGNSRGGPRSSRSAVTGASCFRSGERRRGSSRAVIRWLSRMTSASEGRLPRRTSSGGRAGGWWTRLRWLTPPTSRGSSWREWTRREPLASPSSS